MSSGLQDTSLDLSAFRARYASWLAENVPADWRSRVDEERDVVEIQRAWMRALHAGGWAAAHWPREHGGLDLPLPEQVVMFEENARFDAPPLTAFGMALVHAAVTMMAWGSNEQQRQHLPAILAGDEIWCQGFSEPEAGSDLASLRTTAVRSGETYLVNGQKVWSSRAQYADWCLLLARTGPALSRHRGLTYFLLDMHQPGVSVRPIRTLLNSMEYSEIFLEDVVVPAECMLGQENEGWQVARTTLTAERGVYILPVVNRLGREIESLVAHAAKLPQDQQEDFRQVLARDWEDVAILRALTTQILMDVSEGRSTAQSSLLKLYYSEVAQRVTSHALEIVGLEALVPWVDALDINTPTFDGSWARSHYSSWAWTIGGGTSEIQRNVIAERVLGMPRDPVAERSR